MRLFALEHSKAAYVIDFAVYCGASLGLGVLLLSAGPRAQWLDMAALVLLGLIGWTALEYALHRFVLHGLPPFSRWHAEHHKRPTALICAPTVLSASLIFLLVFLPALALGGEWRACAITFGVLTGYLAYAITHHATHHWHTDNAWVMRRKHWHALHHSRFRPPGHYGVTSGYWDRVFNTSTPTSDNATFGTPTKEKT